MRRAVPLLIAMLVLISVLGASAQPIDPPGRVKRWTPTPTLVAPPTDVPTATATPPVKLTLGTTSPPTSTATATTTATPPLTTVPTTTGTPIPVAGQPCPSSVHDQYKTTGPDGRLYPTWHPAVDPVSGCLFGHEHGDDPRTSLANSTMPAFGYIGFLAGDNEPHTGFKVFVQNHGDIVDHAGTWEPATFDARVVFHQGTSGVNRYVTQFHSLMFDWVARDGSGTEFHTQGMANTGPTASDTSTCDNPRLAGKNFSTLGCPDTYEIWPSIFQVIHPDDPFQGINETRAGIGVSVATFDPITTRNPLDNTSLIYTQNVKCQGLAGCVPGVDPLSPDAFMQGCQREVYMQPYSNNLAGPTVYYTDPFGHVDVSHPNGGPGLLRQLVAVSKVDGPLYKKLTTRYCGNGIHAPN